MRQKSLVHPKQRRPHSVSEAELERLIEQRVAARVQGEAIRWRLRLVTLQTLLLIGLVLAAGLAGGLAPSSVLRAALLVGASCFASGMMLLGFSHAGEKLLSRARRGAAR